MLNKFLAFKRLCSHSFYKKKSEWHYYKHVGRKIITDSQANDLIYKYVQEGRPAFISRFGSSELHSILFFRNERLNKSEPKTWTESYKHILCEVSGYFPFTQEAMDSFSKYYLSFIQNIDLLGVWRMGEDKVSDMFKSDIKLINLQAIEPYYFEKPWSRALEGKKVLVIHPFAKSIARQYSKRHLLFPGTNVLPEFELIILPAVQTVADNTQGFSNWFDALNYMYDKISEVEFDVALIGAGAYGMPLANFIKQEKGKVAIHMGGALQILFGIKGQRWNNIPKVRALYNENWVNSLLDERPNGAELVEDGCYW